MEYYNNPIQAGLVMASMSIFYRIDKLLLDFSYLKNKKLLTSQWS